MAGNERPGSDVRQDPDRQPRRDRLPDHPHLPEARHPIGRGFFRSRRRRPARVARRRGLRHRRAAAAGQLPARRRDHRSGACHAARRRFIRATDFSPRMRISPMRSSAAGLVFIGPHAASMRKMGSKAGAKDLMSAHGVPVVPGYTGEDQDPSLLQREADRDRLPADDQGRARRRRQGHAPGAGRGRVRRGAGILPARIEECVRPRPRAAGTLRAAAPAYRDSRSSPTGTATPSTWASASARRSAATRRSSRNRPRRS